MTAKPVDEFNDHQADPPLMDAETYRSVLEKLLTQGRGYGKTRPVGAYLLRDLRIVTAGDETGDHGRSQNVAIDPLYVVMDTALRPNEYARRLEMKAIASSYVQRIIGEGDINGADFKGPGIWTVKKSSFEADYNRRAGLNEYGTRSNIYDPNPEAYRLALVFSEAATIPTSWGTPWTIHPGGALVIRERDVEELIAALQSIKTGLATAQEVLYTRKSDGTMSAKFDVYGMAPGFLEENYGPVDLKDRTIQSINKLNPS